MERLSVAPEVMEILELEQGQSVNSFIVNAIAELSIKMLKERIEQVTQEIEDEQLTDDFDFRKEMDKWLWLFMTHIMVINGITLITYGQVFLKWVMWMLTSKQTEFIFEWGSTFILLCGAALTSLNI